MLPGGAVLNSVLPRQKRQGSCGKVQELAEGWERYDTWTRVLKMCSLFLLSPELIF